MDIRKYCIICLSLISIGSNLTTPSQSIADELDDALAMNIQQLMHVDIPVTSVSKRQQKLHETASAIYVVTQEDIRRSGAVNIPEALRLVPGVLVSRMDQNQYAISIRGFNTAFTSQKLLVLIDGRSIYNPLFSGVFWASQDTMLEDIDRIEVIRGPGAALWGSNAVDGVINIITKSSDDTKGVLLAGGLGTEEKGFASLRYGGSLPNNFNYRVYGKYRDRDSGKRSDGSDAFDDKQIRQMGFRSDWEANPQDHFTFQGDYYHIDTEVDVRSEFVSFTPPYNTPIKGVSHNTGYNLLGRWSRKLDKGSGFILQTYFDRYGVVNHEEPNDISIDKADIEFQYDFNWNSRHNISWGLNYRYANFQFLNTPAVTLPTKDSHQAGFFFHDEITLLPGTWNLILGSRFEYNEFSGFEAQPNIRTIWTPSTKHTLWASVSRAVRIPSLTDDAVVYNASPAPGVIVRAEADGRTESEELLAFEAGYRVKPNSKVSLDITGYLHQYDNLIDDNVGTPIVEITPAPPHLTIPVFLENGVKGEIYGVELSVEWMPIKQWRLSGNYTFYKADLRKKLESLSGRSLEIENEPNHLFNVRSYLELPFNTQFDAMVYYQSDYPGRDLSQHTRLDLRLGWRPDPKIELSLVGQNILDSKHPEFNDDRIYRTEAERSFYFKGTINF